MRVVRMQFGWSPVLEVTIDVELRQDDEE